MNLWVMFKSVRIADNRNPKIWLCMTTDVHGAGDIGHRRFLHIDRMGQCLHGMKKVFLRIGLAWNSMGSF